MELPLTLTEMLALAGCTVNIYSAFDCVQPVIDIVILINTLNLFQRSILTN